MTIEIELGNFFSFFLRFLGLREIWNLEMLAYKALRQ